MISAVRTNKPRQGFTLIEIIMVLAIASVVMGGAVGVMIFSQDDRVLRSASGEIELLAKRARTTAILHQTPYALEFREGVVRLMPYSQAGLIESKFSRSREAELSPEDANTAENRQYTLDEGISISIRRWNSDTWLGTAKNAFQIWRFDPDGLCEPITVRLALDKSWSEDTYHPLNATIRESQSETR